MNYWPLSLIKDSPLSPPVFAAELNRFYFKTPSEAAFWACLDVASRTTPVSMRGLVVIESVGTPNRYAFTEYPSWDEWERFERAGVIQASDGTLRLMMDGIH